MNFLPFLMSRKNVVIERQQNQLSFKMLLGLQNQRDHLIILNTPWYFLDFAFDKVEAVHSTVVSENNQGR